MDARKNQYRRDYYTDGTAARKLQVVPDIQREEESVVQPRVIRRTTPTPKVSHGIDFISLILLLGAMAIALYICYDYLNVQGNVVQLKRDIVNLESQYDALASSNIALEESLNTQPDWDRVYKIAIRDLGMVYPNKNEVVSYASEEKGYVIQYRNIPE